MNGIQPRAFAGNSLRCVQVRPPSAKRQTQIGSTASRNATRGYETKPKDRTPSPPRSGGRKKCRPTAGKLFTFPAQPVNSDFPALAVIDGTLCRLTREGHKAGGCTPLASAVAEFHYTPFRYYVREHPYGLLPGLPNLYCLDGALRLQWMAEWPAPADPCVAILGEENGILVARAASGSLVRLDAHTGRLRSVETPVAAAS